MDIAIDKPTAIAEGKKYYYGNTCIKCDTTVKKLTNRACYQCSKNSLKGYNKSPERQAYMKEYQKGYRKRPEVRADRKTNKRLYKAQRVHAYPAWADRSKIAEIYENARLTGMHVDHIIPLKHDLVCGLHCEFNLQLMDPIENIKKSNHFTI